MFGNAAPFMDPKRRPQAKPVDRDTYDDETAARLRRSNGYLCILVQARDKGPRSQITRGDRVDFDFRCPHDVESALAMLDQAKGLLQERLKAAEAVLGKQERTEAEEVDPPEPGNDGDGG